MRICGSNAGYTMFPGSVKSIGYPLHSPVSPSLPLPCVTIRHRISTGLHQFSPTLLVKVRDLILELHYSDFRKSTRVRWLKKSRKSVAGSTNRFAHRFTYAFDMHMCDVTLCSVNTLRTGDVDLRFYITTVQDG